MSPACRSWPMSELRLLPSQEGDLQSKLFKMNLKSLSFPWGRRGASDCALTRAKVTHSLTLFAGGKKKAAKPGIRKQAQTNAAKSLSQNSQGTARLDYASYLAYLLVSRRHFSVISAEAPLMSGGC